MSIVRRTSQPDQFFYVLHPKTRTGSDTNFDGTVIATSSDSTIATVTPTDNPLKFEVERTGFGDVTLFFTGDGDLSAGVHPITHQVVITFLDDSQDVTDVLGEIEEEPIDPGNPNEPTV